MIFFFLVPLNIPALTLFILHSSQNGSDGSKCTCPLFLAVSSVKSRVKITMKCKRKKGDGLF